MVSFFGTDKAFLPPLILARKVLRSNARFFTVAPLGVMADHADQIGQGALHQDNFLNI